MAHRLWPLNSKGTDVRSVDYSDGVITLIDQTKLPQAEEMLRIDNVDDLVAAIKRLAVRGAPAIGLAGAYGVALAARLHEPGTAAFEQAVTAIREARPTAVNLAYAVDRLKPLAVGGVAALEAEAHTIRDEELAASVAMGETGADLVLELTGVAAPRVMTICNTGGLAAVERGTALAVIQTLHERHVYKRQHWC